MRRIRAFLGIPIAVCAAIAAGTGCSSSSSSAPPASSAPVSFASDVMPIFQANCTATTACHGQAGNSLEESLYLGDMQNNTPAIVSGVYTGLVGVTSVEDNELDLVKPSDHAQSYLYLKVADATSQLDTMAADCSTCTVCQPAEQCGVQMPFGLTPLGTSDLQTIANWIDQGAKNN